MRYTPQRRGGSKASFIQAVLLMVFLIIGLIGYNVLKRGVFTSGLNSFINMDVRNFRPLESIKEEQKEALKKVFGGFWVHRTEREDSYIVKNDFLELRDNGIIWQVIHWLVSYPCGDTGSYYHIRYAYLNPYGIAADGKSVVCEVRTIRQVYVNGIDTCFGPSQVDELWMTRKEDSLLVMNRKRYEPYRGKLSDFFPEGMIDLVDRIEFKDCRSGLDLAKIIEENLYECYRSDESTRNCDTAVAGKNLIGYFKTAFIDEIFSSIPYFPKLPDSIVIPIIIKYDGSAELGLSKSKRAQADHFKARILNRIEKWPFPRCDAANSRVFVYTAHLPEP